MTRESRCFVLLLALLLLSASLAFAQDTSGAKPKRARTPEDYKSRTLKELSAKEQAATGSETENRTDKEETLRVRADTLPSAVRVGYTGLKRPLPLVKKELLLQWARLYAGAMESYTVPYESEMLFNENGVGYWLPVRKRSLPDFERSLKRGDEVDLYLIRLGAVRVSQGWEPLLLVESFRKPE
ncbi:MAG TPA: hypothetical protein VGB73_09815 [Pyrinomonadaceae bacterium]|jgi:hypothetical protein